MFLVGQVRGVVAEFPPLPRLRGVARLHQQLLVVRRQRHALPTASVAQCLRLKY